VILTLSNEGWVDACANCGERSTYFFDRGSAKGREGPYILAPGMDLAFRIDDDNGGPGYIEIVTFEEGDFSDWNKVTCNQLVERLKRDLRLAMPRNDFEGILVVSNSSGPQSCVEVVAGFARGPLGFMLYGPDGNHTCCGRPCLGWVNADTDLERPQPDIILLRRCACGCQASYLPSALEPLERHGLDDRLTAQRYAVNALARHLANAGHVDVDLKEHFAMKDRFSSGRYHPGFPRSDGEVLDLWSYDAFMRDFRPPGIGYRERYDAVARKYAAEFRAGKIPRGHALPKPPSKAMA
jgi:hypothetical protein